MNKKIISLCLLYFFQLIASSCDPCNCDPAKTFERTDNGIELKAWNISGLQNEEISNPINKNSIGLSISIESELNQIVSSKSKLNFRAFGFASAYALSCDCDPDIFINVDPIESILITVVDTETKEIRNITNNFTTYSFNYKELTIRELFEVKPDWHDGFQLDLTKYDNIPDASIFIVKIILQSGIELVEQTQEINFE